MAEGAPNRQLERARVECQIVAVFADLGDQMSLTVEEIADRAGEACITLVESVLAAMAHPSRRFEGPSGPFSLVATPIGVTPRRYARADLWRGRASLRRTMITEWSLVCEARGRSPDGEEVAVQIAIPGFGSAPPQDDTTEVILAVATRAFEEIWGFAPTWVVRSHQMKQQTLRIAD